jgi:thiol-disulfide isomerase/thioredoxin
MQCYIVCATWCKPCKEIVPQIFATWERFGQDAGAIQKLDYDEMDDWPTDVAELVGDVKKLPTVLVCQGGKELARFTENQVAGFTNYMVSHMPVDATSDDF